MKELLDQLKATNNERELFENLLAQVMEGSKEAKITAARIQAGRDIRFDLEKIIKENGNNS
jgi:hypothetical protein